jgi:peptidoglycan/xylan/chitin deacetylase (PgdA/CDA1 family)
LAAAGAHFVPSVATIPALRDRALPGLSGQSQRPHIALTFDDGPDPESTPRFLDELARLGVHATFFLLGSQVDAHPEIAKLIASEGHEVALHAWLHRSHLLRSPLAVEADVARAYQCIQDATGVVPRFWRPPNGIVSGAGFLAAYRHRLRPVLWTADGLDWRADATSASVLARVGKQLSAGGTVLLHDSDITSAAGSWRSGLGALPGLVSLCAQRGWELGPLKAHWAG